MNASRRIAFTMGALFPLVFSVSFPVDGTAEEPPKRVEKKLDHVDTVWILSLDREGERLIAVTRGQEEDGSPGPVGRTYVIDEKTVVRSGDEQVPISALEIGDRVVVEASVEPDLAEDVEARRSIAREILVVVDRPSPDEASAD